jgi:iron(III) transport system permease protein
MARDGRGLAALALLWLVLIGAVPLLRLLAEGAAGPGATLADPAIWRATWRSLVVACGAAGLAAVLGAALAWALLLRGPVPARRSLVFCAVLPVLVPPQVMALGWIQAAGPSSPLLLALDLAPPLGTTNPVYSPAGMMLLLGVQGTPLVFLTLAATLRRIPGEAVLAARGLGAAPEAALRQVVWPLLAPALAAGAGLAYVAALGNFGVGALIGIPARYIVLTVLIWQKLSTGGATALAEAAAIALLLALMAAPALALQGWAARAAPLAGRLPFAPIALGRPRRGVAALVVAYLAVVLLVPLAALAAAALVPAVGVQIGADTVTLRNFTAALAPGSHTARAIGNSLTLSLGAAAILAVAALPIALSLRRREVKLGSAAADLPYALPGTCTAVAAILVVLSVPGGMALYGSLAVILLAYLTRFQALALRPVAAAAARLDPLLDHAARGLGAGTLRRVVSIHAPPLAPALAAGAILVALTAINEVTVSVLLYGPGTQTLGVLVFTLQDSGQSAQAAAVSCLALALMAGLMAAATLAARRLPAGTLPWRP